MANRAGTAITTAATLIRAATAAPDVQPASMSERANEPDVLKVAADATARSETGVVRAHRGSCH